MGKNFYEILGVSQDASIDDITIAYKKHPLHAISNKHESEKFIGLCEAYAILRDPDYRARYNQKLCHENVENPAKKMKTNPPDDSGVSSHSQSNSDATSENVTNMKRRDINIEINAIVNNPKPSSSHCSRPLVVKDPNTDYDVFVTLEELAKGCIKRALITRYVLRDDLYAIHRKLKKVKITIPAGCKNGKRYKFKGFGNKIKGGIAADAIFTVREKKHPYFERDGNDLIYTAYVTLFQLERAKKLNVPLLGGENMWIDLHGGAIERIPGYGFPLVNDCKTRGDLIVRLKLDAA